MLLVEKPSPGRPGARPLPIDPRDPLLMERGDPLGPPPPGQHAPVGHDQRDEQPHRRRWPEPAHIAPHGKDAQDHPSGEQAKPEVPRSVVKLRHPAGFELSLVQSSRKLSARVEAGRQGRGIQGGSSSGRRAGPSGRAVTISGRFKPPILADHRPPIQPIHRCSRLSHPIRWHPACTQLPVS